MNTIAFDTLKAFSKLEAAGMETGQAKAVVDTMAEAFDDTVATKADIAEVKADIDKLAATTKAEIAGLKADLKIIKYFFGPAIILLLLKIAFSPPLWLIFRSAVRLLHFSHDHLYSRHSRHNPGTARGRHGFAASRSGCCRHQPLGCGFGN